MARGISVVNLSDIKARDEEANEILRGLPCSMGANEALRHLAHRIARLTREKAALREALQNIAGGMYSREVMSDEALQAAVASVEGKAAWRERCISELQAMARAALEASK